LKINPNQKFYISSDLPDEIIGYFYEKYKDNIIDKKIILDIVYDYIITSGIKKSELEYGNVVPNLVDLFSLSFCRFLIKVPTSTWSNFAENYVRKESAFVTEDWTIIKKKYPIELTLTERLEMKHPVLLGRKFISKKFLVDTSRKNLSLNGKIIKIKKI